MPLAPRGRALALLGALTIATAACGGAASPTPTASAAPAAPTPSAAVTPKPSPTPASVADEFLAQLIAARTGVLEMSGAMTIGKTEIPISGTMTMAGSDTQSAMTLELPTGSQTSESIRVGTAEWKRANGGPWVVNPKPADRSKTLSAFLGTLTKLEDKGVATWKGRQLHRLVAPASETVSAESLGFTSPSMRDAKVSLEFWAEDDGTPANWSFVVTWDQVTGTTTVPVKMTLDFDLAGLGGTATATVTPPEDPWESFTSTRFGYSMAHPQGWSVGEEKDGDQYLMDGTPYVYVVPQAAARSTLDKFHKDLVAHYAKQEVKAKPDADEEYTIGGTPARVLTYHFTNPAGQKLILIDAITVHGDKGWEVFLIQEATNEKEARTGFDSMVSTFSFEK